VPVPVPVLAPLPEPVAAPASVPPRRSADGANGAARSLAPR
jgi:hypothetical protein